MLTIYWFCFLIGGIFVALAVLGGLDGIEFEFEVDTDVEVVDRGDAPQQQRRLTRRQRRAQKGKFPLFGILKSLKFWTFGSCFFGLTGLLLSMLNTGLPAFMITMIAAAMGILCGTAISGILLALRRRQVDSLVRAEDLVGLTGTVEIPFNVTSKGKVRLNVKGSMVDFVAFTDDPKTLTTGDQVLVVGTKQNRVWVVSADTLNQPPEELESG